MAAAWPCLAADATWVADSTLAEGTSPYCAGGQFPGPQWTAASEGQVRISGNSLTYTTGPGWFPASSFTLDLAAENLANETYRLDNGFASEGVEGPGRNLRVALSARY